ncbi:hypothetical protein [uncultured Hydrogenophaga sp.]|uniref:hypothetical protein n=1 Tax=uncultured Hydrogenophaga sp. TaxID=199683 RepID=UPI0026601B36|nr:hypothetical protein [uncultured Hydrogenophaga sp.]
MPELPALPSDDSDVEGEIFIEILQFERYEVVDLHPVDSSPSPTPPSSPRWPSSPGSHGSALSPRGQFLGNKPRDNLQ